MSFFNRFHGIIFNPRETFKVISEKPVWVDCLIILLILLALFSYLVAPYLQKDSLQTMKENVKLKEKYGEERYNQIIQRLENPSKKSVLIRSFALGPLNYLVGFLFSSLILLGMGRLTSVNGNYRQVFSAYLHANFVDKILGNVLRLVLVFARKSFMQTTTSFALLFPKLEMTSLAYIVFSQVDFFQLWLFGIFAYGLFSIFKIEQKKALIISYSFWLLKSLLYIAIGLLTASYMR